MPGIARPLYRCREYIYLLQSCHIGEMNIETFAPTQVLNRLQFRAKKAVTAAANGISAGRSTTPCTLNYLWSIQTTPEVLWKHFNIKGSNSRRSGSRIRVMNFVEVNGVGCSSTTWANWWATYVLEGSERH